MARLVAAMALGVIQRLIGPPQNIDRRLVRADRYKSNTHRHLPHLREHMAFHIGAEAVDDFLRIVERRRAQQHDEFLAAETEYAVLRAERGGHQIGDENEHLVAVKMAEF